MSIRRGIRAFLPAASSSLQRRGAPSPLLARLLSTTVNGVPVEVCAHS
jgi:hypothetical protein